MSDVLFPREPVLRPDVTFLCNCLLWIKIRGNHLFWFSLFCWSTFTRPRTSTKMSRRCCMKPPIKNTSILLRLPKFMEKTGKESYSQKMLTCSINGQEMVSKRPLKCPNGLSDIWCEQTVFVRVKRPANIRPQENVSMIFTCLDVPWAWSFWECIHRRFPS